MAGLDSAGAAVSVPGPHRPVDAAAGEPGAVRSNCQRIHGLLDVPRGDVALVASEDGSGLPILRIRDR